MSEDGQTAIGFLTRLGHDTVGHFALEHQHGTRPPDRLGFEPFDQEQRADIIGQVGENDPIALCQDLGFPHLQRVGLDDVHLAGIGGAYFVQGAEETRILLDDGEMFDAVFENAPGQTARTGADLDGLGVAHITGQAGDLAGQVEIEQEVLAKAFLGAEIMRGNNLAQGREPVFAHDARCPAISPAVRIAATRLSGRAVMEAAISKAVPWSGEVRTIGRPSVMFTPPWKSSVLTGISP